MKTHAVAWSITLPGGLPTALVRKPSIPRGRDRRLLPGIPGVTGSVGEETRLLAACRAYGAPIESIVVISP